MQVDKVATNGKTVDNAASGDKPVDTLRIPSADKEPIAVSVQVGEALPCQNRQH